MSKTRSGFYHQVSDRALAGTQHLSGNVSAVRRASAEDTSTQKRREGFNRWDIEEARPEDRLPTKRPAILLTIQAMYRKVGLVRNMIDLMADFASESMAIAHPVKSQEVFFQEWARRTNLAERAHEFMRLLLRDGNVVGRRQMAKIGKAAQREFLAAGALPKVKKTPRQPIGEIPWKYSFINPVIVEKSAGAIGRFLGDQSLDLVLPPSIVSKFRNPKSDKEKELMAQLPDDIRKALGTSRALTVKIPLDPATTFVAHYKKDDWADWATPFLYAILDDLMFKDKMRLADMAALDGIINVIRLWKLGKSEQKILPGKPAVNKLLGILQNNVGGGVLDIVWDDMIDFKIEYPPVDKILGSAKYESVNRDIQMGMGIPDVLAGNGGKGGAAGGMISLKTVTERLEYVRERAIEWLDAECRIVMRAMRWKIPPVVAFGTMSLRDEVAEKQLLIQLADRGIISVEAIHNAFEHNTLVELERLRREQKLRTTDEPLLERAGPYYRPVSQLKLQFEQQRALLEAKGNSGGGGDGGGDNLAGDQPRKTTIAPTPGRPPNTRDTKTRDTRTPKTVSIQQVAAESAMAEIDQLVDPAFLRDAKKPNIRSLSGDQREQLEAVKASLLAQLTFGERVTKKRLQAIAKRGDKQRTQSLMVACQQLSTEYQSAIGRAPNASERRKLLCSAWVIMQE